MIYLCLSKNGGDLNFFSVQYLQGLDLVALQPSKKI